MLLLKIGNYLLAQTVKNLPAILETWVWSMGWEDPLEKRMATHSSILAWRIPWTEESGGLQSMGSQRDRHSWVTDTFIFHFTENLLMLSFSDFLLTSLVIHNRKHTTFKNNNFIFHCNFWIFFFNLTSFKIEIQIIYNVELVSGIEQNYIYIYIICVYIYIYIYIY